MSELMHGGPNCLVVVVVVVVLLLLPSAEGARNDLHCTLTLSHGTGTDNFKIITNRRLLFAEECETCRYVTDVYATSKDNRARTSVCLRLAN